jgi:hypothetical protein
MADKITPERMQTALLRDGGTQFIYAPEASVFFGRQKYNEGLTTLMLRLLDCPDHFEVETQARQKEPVENIALCILAGSTLSLLANSAPEEVTSSGFLNRFVLVVEEDTCREFPEPEEGLISLREKLDAELERLKTFSGEMTWQFAAKKWYDEWYHQRKLRNKQQADEITVEVLERLTDHFLRTVMLVHLTQCDDMHMCVGCCETAARLIEYTEKSIPRTVAALKQTIVSQDTDYVLDTLRRLGGAADHSRLLRRCGARLDATRFKKHISTLVEQKIIKEEVRGAARYYIIIGTEDEYGDRS